MDGKGKGKQTEDRNGKGKGKGKGNSKGKDIDRQTPGRDNISRAVALQWQKRISEVDLDTEGYLERPYFEQSASPAVSVFSDGETDSAKHGQRI